MGEDEQDKAKLMIRMLCIAAFAVVMGSGAQAELSEDQRALFEALGLPDIIEVMREEGVDYGRSMEDMMFPGRGGAAWSALVERIYDPVAMEEKVAGELAELLEEDAVGPLLEFFTSERGERIISFEVSARQALTDPDIEAAANERLEMMRRADDGRLELLEQFVEVNDLIGSNLMGAMNSNFAFYQGLIDGNGVPEDLTEEEMLATIWAQEEEVREETETWVFSYLAMAYQPLSDEDVEAYIALSESDEGQTLNRALFASFDAMYSTISRALGLAAARFMLGQDI
ncbi:MAG: hypothetical protein AAFQ79_06040 [Pseudomonadota bacterium]